MLLLGAKVSRSSLTNTKIDPTALQEFEGFSGALIIRTPKSDDPNGYTYDFDPYSFVFHLSDWMHMMADDKYPGANRNASLIIQKADSYLVNGYGIYGVSSLRRIVLRCGCGKIIMRFADAAGYK